MKSSRQLCLNGGQKAEAFRIKLRPFQPQFARGSEFRRRGRRGREGRQELEEVYVGGGGWERGGEMAKREEGGLREVGIKGGFKQKSNNRN